MSHYSDIQTWYEHFEITPYHDLVWPDNLMLLEDAEPETLYGIGDSTLLKGKCVTITGARKATPYGIACARMAGQIAAECDLIVINGGTIGCEAAALEGALDAGGKCIIAAPCSPDVLYPTSNDELFCNVLEQGGAVVSDSGWNVSGSTQDTAQSRRAMLRVLSRDYILVEGDSKSSPVVCAQEAASLGMRVMCFPGPIFIQDQNESWRVNPNSAGTNDLINQGADAIIDEGMLAKSLELDFGTARRLTFEQYDYAATVKGKTHINLQMHTGQGPWVGLVLRGDCIAPEPINKQPDAFNATARDVKSDMATRPHSDSPTQQHTNEDLVF